jgi:hypothetical protein
MSEKRTIPIFLIIVLLLAGGLGFMVFRASSEYREALAGFQRASVAVDRLKGAPLFPSADNVATRGEALELYRDTVDDLHASLAAMQPRIDPGIDPVGFQASLEAKVEEMKTMAEQEGMVVPEGYAFDLERYLRSLPSDAAAPSLELQLRSLEVISHLLLESGVEQLDRLEREVLAIEAGDPGDDEGTAAAEVVDYQTIRVRFRGRESALRRVITGLSNPNDEGFHFILRVLRVENEQKVGPAKEDTFTPTPVGGSSVGDFGAFEGADVLSGVEMGEYDPVLEGAIPDAPLSNEEAGEEGVVTGEGAVIEGGAEGGALDSGDDVQFDDGQLEGGAGLPGAVVPESGIGGLPMVDPGGQAGAVIDVRDILGAERLYVYAEIDLATFKAPPVVEESEIESENAGGVQE